MRREVIILFFVVVVLISGASCESVDNVNQTTNLNPVELQKQIDDLKAQVENLKQEKEKLQQENQELKEKYEPKDIGTSLDISAWSADDIFNKFKSTDGVFARGGWYTYEYSDSTYYDKFGQQFYGEDEFYEIKYSSINRELNVSHLRMFKLGLKNSVEEEYQDYVDKIGAKASADSSLQCVNSLGCRDIKITECSKAGKKFFAWFADEWLFTARDDGYALEVFKKFYC